jgi:hypothetical protein
MMNNSQEEIGQPSIVYYPLYMLIMWVSRDSGHMPDSDRKTRLRSYVRLRSYARLRSEDTTLVGRYDSGRISRLRLHFLTSVNVMTPVVSLDSCHGSWLRSMSMMHVLPPQLWKTSHGWARWLQHLTTRTLSWKQIGRDAWLVQRLKP